jgi:O-antigen ligase
MQGVFHGAFVNLFDRPTQAKTWSSWCLSFLLVLPWLEPWAPSPLANVVPLLISWGCIGLVMASGWTLRPVDIARAWAIAALLSSLIGLLQYFGQADAWGAWMHAPDYPGEARGNLRQRNQLATLTAMGLIAIFCWVRMGLQRPQAVWMLALVAMGNAATNSRTGLLQMLLVTGLVFWWSVLDRTNPQRLSWRLALWALGVYALATWALPFVLSMTSGQDSINALTRLGHDDGCGSRKVLWRNVLELIAQKPWWGWGWDELKYAHYSASYSGERFCEILGNAHNGPLQLAFTLGVPLAALIMVSLLVIVLYMRPWQSRQTPQQLAWGALAVIGLHSLLEFPLWYGPFQMAVLLCTVLLLPARLSSALAQSRITTIVGTAILATVAFIAVDYSRVRQIFIPPGQRTGFWSGDALSLAKSSVLFQDTAKFAEFSVTPVTPENAARMLESGHQMLHYSPEPQVIRKVIKAALMAGDSATVERHRALIKTAFPSEPDAVKPTP